MGKENPQQLSHFMSFKRLAVLHIGHGLLPGELIVEGEDLKKAEQLCKEGNGLVVMWNHIALRDPLQVVGEAIFRNPILRRREVHAPIAKHQSNPIYEAGVKLFGARLIPVATGETKKKMTISEAEWRLMSSNYIADTVETLQAGNIVLVSPKPTRSPKLEMVPQEFPISYIVTRLLRKGINNVAFLFVGIGIDGVKDYSSVPRGYNLRTKFQVKVGQTFTLEEALSDAEQFETVDHWARAQLAKVVPIEYLPQSAETDPPTLDFQ